MRDSMANVNKAVGPTCPHCGSNRIRREHRRSAVERFLLRCLWLRAFRCLGCYRRFYSHSRLLYIRSENPPVIAARPNSMPLEWKPQKEPAAISAVPERRGFSRLRCEIPVRIEVPSSQRISGIVTELSLTGCFVQSLTTLSAGSEIELFLDTKEPAHSRGVVRRLVPAKGMGIEFVFTTAPNFRRLQHIASGSIRLHAAS
jgi:PilZ domain